MITVQGQDDLVCVQGGHQPVLLVHHLELDVARDGGGGGEEGGEDGPIKIKGVTNHCDGRHTTDQGKLRIFLPYCLMSIYPFSFHLNRKYTYMYLTLTFRSYEGTEGPFGGLLSLWGTLLGVLLSAHFPFNI